MAKKDDHVTVIEHDRPQIGFSGRNELKRVKFYHGVQTKEDVKNIMEKASVGDYLIRAKMLKNEVALSLFFCVKVSNRDNEIHHYLIDFKEDKKFSLQQKQHEVTVDEKKHPVLFESYDDMVSHYKTHRLLCGIRLGNALKRPKWQLRHSNIIYEEADRLGSGNFCHVYHGKLNKKNEPPKEAAIKISKTTEKDSAKVMETRNLLVAEAKMMINYKHPNVVMLYGLACDMPPFMVCLEFCCGGTVESLLYKYGTNMEEFERQASRGMRYLHTQKCIHRDLASRNCLIDAEGRVKIADFGLSKSLAVNQTAIKEALKEAPLVWLAPECIQKESEFSSKTDVWAFGVLIYEVYFNGEKPFANEKNDGIIVKAIRKAKMPTIENRTKVVKMQKLLAAIWVRKPEDRPDFQKILEMLGEIPEDPNIDALKTFQMNQLKGVHRKHLPNLSFEDDQVVDTTNNDFEYSIKKIDRSKDKTKKCPVSTSSRVRKSKNNLEDVTIFDGVAISKRKKNSGRKISCVSPSTTPQQATNKTDASDDTAESKKKVKTKMVKVTDGTKEKSVDGSFEDKR